MNRKTLLQDLMDLSLALRDDVRQGVYLECALSIADLKQIGPFTFRQKYQGMILFREFQAPEAPLLGYWQYELGLRSYSVIFSWRKSSGEKKWRNVYRLQGRYTNFDPLDFAAFAKSAMVRVAEWIQSVVSQRFHERRL